MKRQITHTHRGRAKMVPITSWECQVHAHKRDGQASNTFAEGMLGLIQAATTESLQ